MALSVGKREKTSKAAWVVLRHNATSARMMNCVPVMEAAAAKRAAQPIERRVQCNRCRLTSLQRGLCEHEAAVVASLNRIEEETNDADDQHEPTRSVNRLASTLPRWVVPCKSDEHAIRVMTTTLTTLFAKRCQAGDVDEHGHGRGGLKKIRIDLHIQDYYRICSYCRQPFFTADGQQNCTLQSRQVILHTLSVWIDLD